MPPIYPDDTGGLLDRWDANANELPPPDAAYADVMTPLPEPDPLASDVEPMRPGNGEGCDWWGLLGVLLWLICAAGVMAVLVWATGR